MRLVEERKTSVKIYVPFLDTANHLLGGSDSFGRTRVLANSIIRAEGIDFESALRRGRKWNDEPNSEFITDPCLPSSPNPLAIAGGIIITLDVIGPVSDSASQPCLRSYPATNFAAARPY
jgi:hypothetical protein